MIRAFRRIFPAALAILFAVSSVAFSAPPNAGQLLREQKPQRRLPTQLPPAPQKKVRPPLKKTGIQVTVKGFKFTGYQGLATQKELQALVSGAVGKRLDFSHLQELARKVTDYLRKKGWFLARAYLPQQDVTSGIIEIAIVQGTSDGTLHFHRKKNVRIEEKVLKKIGEQAVHPGKPLKKQPLERSLLLMNDLPGVTARASLSPGKTPGSTAVHIDVSEGPLLSGEMWSDDYGNRYTGAWRGNGLVDINDPFGRGDQFSLLLTGAEGLLQGKASYLFPLGATGLRGNLSYTGMHYKLIGGLSSLDGNGDSNVVDAGLSYPLLRSRITNVTATFNYEFKDLVDRLQGLATSRKHLHTGAFGLSGSRYDRFFGGGYSTFKIGATIGSLSESGPDIRITNTEGSFTLFNFQAARLQKLARRVTLNLSWSAQLSLNNLDSSEQFNLGGPYGIRAYPVGEASGDEGQMFNADLYYDVPIPADKGTLKADLFFDAGHITLHKNPWANAIATATGENNYWLKGMGVGFTYNYDGRVSLSATWSHVIGNNPGRSIQNNDADGRSLDNRFWVQAMVYF